MAIRIASLAFWTSLRDETKREEGDSLDVSGTIETVGYTVWRRICWLTL